MKTHYPIAAMPLALISLVAPAALTAVIPAPAASAASGGKPSYMAPQNASAEDLAVVRQRLRESFLPGAGYQTPASVEDTLKTMRPDGSWADQDYADTNREVWKASAHLGRVVNLARAYYAPGTSLSGRPEVKERIIASLGYWLRVDPKNDNWWHNEIGVPLQVGTALLLMGEDAPPPLREQGAALMTRANMTKMTGQNLVWTAQIQVMRGCITNEPALVAAAYDRMWQEVRYADKGEEGIQRDASFHQHGPLIYAGGYGQGFTADVARFASYALGTRFALAPEKLAILETYVLDGQQWMLRGRQWDHGVTGREFIRVNKSAAGMASTVSLLAQIPSPRQAEMREFAARLKGEPGAKPLSGNRHYWLSDYMAHHRPGYFASTHMYSTRTANTDGLTNGENKQTHHIADGAMYLARDGEEYVGIYPVWDWRRIPGTTVEQRPTPLEPKLVRRMGPTRFVGGVSDGAYGAAAMDLKYDDLSAKKAWFYFDDQIVCLGAGISCPTDNPVSTSLNQTLLRGPVRTSADANADLPRGTRDITGAAWVWHDGFGYVFPKGHQQNVRVHLRNDAQTGSWGELGPWSTEPVTKDVFNLWLDHGARPENGTYAYVIVPGADAAKTAATAVSLPVQIVSNTPGLQAVWHKDLKMGQVVFHAPGEVQVGGITITANRPRLVQIRREGDKVRLAVANPENEPGPLGVVVQVPGKSNRPERLTGLERLQLPGDLEAGKTLVQEFTVP